jgi:hypothetical protein
MGLAGESRQASVGAERDSERAGCPALQAEAGMPSLPHRAHVAQASCRDEQPYPGVPDPERAEALELLSRLQAEAVAADHGVHGLDAEEVHGLEGLAGPGHERLPERMELCRLDLEPGGGPVSAEAD